MPGPRPHQSASKAPEAALAEDGKTNKAAAKMEKGGPKKPKKRLRMAKKPGQAPSAGNKPSLLCDELERKICQYLREGASIVDASIMSGVHQVTVADWRSVGSQQPESRFGLFYRRTEEARTEWKCRGIARMSESSDLKNFWRLLCSRYPREFRNYFSHELSGPDGQSIPMQLQANPFHVVIETASDPEAEKQEFSVRPYEKAGNGEQP
jgi:hypothetical protein